LVSSRRSGEHVGPGVAHPVDPVAEAHQPLAALELRPQHRLGPLRRADVEDRLEHRARRPAVERPLERADGRGDRRDQVGADVVYYVEGRDVRHPAHQDVTRPGN